MNSEKVKEIKGKLQEEIFIATKFDDKLRRVETKDLQDILTLINELEECSEKWQKLCADEVALNTPLKERNKELENRVKELEDGIAKSMLGCEFLPECTKEIAEKIWNMSKITVDATKHIIQGREYLHLDALKEIIKSLGVEIKE